MLDGATVGWLVKRDGIWRAYLVPRRGMQIVIVAEGHTREEATEAVCLLAEAHDLC